MSTWMFRSPKKCHGWGAIFSRLWDYELNFLCFLRAPTWVSVALCWVQNCVLLNALQHQSLHKKKKKQKKKPRPHWQCYYLSLLWKPGKSPARLRLRTDLHSTETCYDGMVLETCPENERLMRSSVSLIARFQFVALAEAGLPLICHWSVFNETPL